MKNLDQVSQQEAQVVEMQEEQVLELSLDLLGKVGGGVWGMTI